jgi:hypothetical protein
MYVKSRGEVREWILYGAPRARDPHLDPQRLISMPAYEKLLSSREVDDLVAYFLAVSGWDPEIPDAAFEGRKVAERAGCFGCHGPSGMGGIPNPGSFKGEIPPWDGEDFTELVRDDDELREWILDGRIRRLEQNPLARYFLEGQIVQMPAYRDSLSQEELARLVAYIRWLRERS